MKIGDPSAKAVRTVWERDRGQCQRCWASLTWENRGFPYGWNIQHRKARGRGGDNRLSNLILLCGSGTTGCHGWVEEHPYDAQEAGWAIPGSLNNMWIDHVPVQTPHGMMALDDAGGLTMAT